MRYAVVVFLLVGCETANTSAQDLAVRSDDLAVADLTDLGAADLASADLDLLPLDTAFCANLRLAIADGGVTTDCAAEYFARLVRCFKPAGSCGRQYQLNNEFSECWDDGAMLHYVAIGGTAAIGYGTGSRTCATVGTNAGVLGTGTTGFVWGSFCVSTDTYECGHYLDDMGGAPGSAYYYLGVLTCPDGTKVNIGALGDCAELSAALFPTCDFTRDGDAGVCAF